MFIRGFNPSSPFVLARYLRFIVIPSNISKLALTGVVDFFDKHARTDSNRGILKAARPEHRDSHKPAARTL